MSAILKNEEKQGKLVFLVRHGETDWNRAPKRLQGKRDIPLNQNGLSQAKCLSEFFKEEDIAAVYSSPLQRAYQTAEIINRFHNLSIIMEEQLVEMEFGIWEGEIVTRIQHDQPHLWEQWKENPQELKLPRAESLLKLVNRSMEAVRRVSAMLGRKKIIVTHGAFLRAAMLGFSGRPLSSFNKYEQGNASINIIVFTPQADVISENYTEHLMLMV